MALAVITYKIYIAKVLYFIIRLFNRNDQKIVSRNGINWFLDLNEGIDLSIYIFGNFEDADHTTNPGLKSTKTDFSQPKMSNLPLILSFFCISPSADVDR